jgi:exoribonuclease-2
VEKGTLVEFRLNGNRQLGVVQGMEGKKNLVLTGATGQSHTVHPRQITFVVAGLPHCTPADISPFWQEVQSYLDPESLTVAWEFLLEDGQPVEPADMADILYSNRAPACTYAAYRLLSEDRLYFKQKGDAFEPRSRAQVEELQHQMDVAARKQQEQAEFENRLQQALQGNREVEWSAADRLKLESLERFALYGDEASDKARAIELLQQLHRSSTSDSAFDTLVDLGCWNPHENLTLRRTQAPVQFSADAIAAARTLLEQSAPDDIDRTDLTGLHTYTIDDASTREIDDGLSLEFLPTGGERLWIHIADPTRWIVPGHPLELEARRRATSIYLPDRTIPMFPIELAAGPMSLRQGEVCPALSFGIELAPDGAISAVQICPSWIKVSYRLTYDDTDEMLELGVERELSAIAAAAQLRYQWRVQQKAINITLPETEIKVANGQPIVRVIEDTPARQMVSEMMVLAGAAAAQIASEHAIPIPFRQQPAPELPDEEDLALMSTGPVRAFAIMRCMKRGEIVPVPGRHAGLGLDAYSQVTSPIRRYSDLMAHFQLKAFLAGRPLPFTDTEIKEAILVLSETTQEATQVERQTNRYWTLEFFRQNPGKVWRSLILGHLREHENLALVMVDEIAFRIPVRFERRIEPGEWVHLAVRDVRPRHDTIDFREMG